MGLKTFTVDFAELANKSSLRGDFRFSSYYKKDLPYRRTYFKNFIIKLRNGKDIGKNNYVPISETEIIYPTVNNIKPTGLKLDNVTAIDNDFAGGYYLDNKDIVITRSGTVGITKCWQKKEINSYLGKNVEAIPSGYLIVAKTNDKKVNPFFVEHFFNSSLLSEYFFVFGVGKSQRNIAQGDIKYLPFPLIPKPTQDQIVAQIEPIEKKIKKLNAQIKEPQAVINMVFSIEFGFDLEQFKVLKKVKLTHIDCSAFANNKDLRNSVKFHRQAGQFVLDELKKRTRKRIKDFISEPVILGKGISPKQYCSIVSPLTVDP